MAGECCTTASAGQHPDACGDLLPDDHHFVGPLVRTERLPDALRSWTDRASDRPQVFVALGTFLSHREDVLARIAAALRAVDARAAIATGATPPRLLGPVPRDWIVAPALPQVAMLPYADLAIHHGGNNSVQESLAVGTPPDRPAVLDRSVRQRRRPRAHGRGGRRIAERRDRRRPRRCDQRQPRGRPVVSGRCSRAAVAPRRAVRLNSHLACRTR